MAKSVTVEINDEFFEQVLRSKQVRALTRRKAEQVAKAARASAPVRHGHYRNSIHVETKRARFRDVEHVVASVPYAMGVEYRTGNLARALRKGGR